MPSNSRRFALTMPGLLTRRRMARPVIDLPEPDSPTMPSFSRPSEKETPRTASTSPLRDGKETCRRSEEHTSELQSLMRISYAVFCLKKKKIETITKHIIEAQYTHEKRR